MLASRSDKTRMATMLVGLTLAAAASAALFAASPTVAAEKLPKLGAALSQTSVSGLSSGAFMASQFEVAHAENVVGAGIVAGGPFACAETATARLFPYWLTGVAQNAIQAAQQCMQTTLGEPDAAKLFARAKELADHGEIDPLPALAKHNVYLYSGDEDSTVSRPVVEAAKRFYELAGVPEANLTYVRGSGGHAFITEEGGAACGLSEPPFVSDCDYDQARAILGWIYGPLKPASAKAQGAFIVFEQGEFAGDGGGLADEGVVYVPASCRTEPGCRVHVALHGMRTEPRHGRRCLHPRRRVCSLGRQQSPHCAFSTGRDEPIQSAGLLGLVGLYGPGLSWQGCAADQRTLENGRALG